MRILITNASYHNTLAATRALGKRGMNVTVAGRKGKIFKFSPSFHSKYCSEKEYYTSPRKNTEGFVQDLLGIVKKNKYDVLLPMGLSCVIPVVKHLNEFSDYVNVPFGPYSKAIQAHDKSQTIAIASDLNVPVPETYIPHSISELKENMGKVTFPAVIKPRKGAGAKGVFYAKNPRELIEIYRSTSNDQETVDNSKLIYDRQNPLIQEYVDGTIHDVCLIAKQGKVLAMLTQKRLKTLPPQGGSGILNQTTDIEILKEYSRRLINEIGYHGLAQVEFKYDTKSEQYKLMEINPKFWGTLALSIEAGINFPLLATNLANDKKIDLQSDYKVGIKYRWPFPQEILAMLESGNKLAAIGDFFIPKNALTDFSIMDPIPNILQIASTIPKAFSSF